jgi:aspartate--ammonia ligase
MQGERGCVCDRNWAKLKDGRPHEDRTAYYDDRSKETSNGKRCLNGDILVWYPKISSAFELPSMGIRVDKDSLLRQLEIKGEQDKAGLYFHQRLLQEKQRLTIGGGIGESRLCMLYLRKPHIGEVQSIIWPYEIVKMCKENKVFLL